MANRAKGYEAGYDVTPGFDPDIILRVKFRVIPGTVPGITTGCPLGRHQQVMVLIITICK